MGGGTFFKVGGAPAPCAGVATGLLKTPRAQHKTGKNDTALIPVLNTFKITTFQHLEHRSSMTEYSLCNGIRHQDTKTRQSICSNHGGRTFFKVGGRTRARQKDYGRFLWF